MTRTRLAALFVALAMLASMFGFVASAENETVLIEVSFAGQGTVTVDGVSHDSWFTLRVPVGQTVTLTAEALDDEYDGTDFLFWLNEERLRIVSREQTYSFVAATYAKLQVVFDLKESIAQADGVHTVVYLSEGDNIRFFDSGVDLGDTSYYDFVPQNGLIVTGKVFKGWDHTLEQVAEETGRVFVRPVYEIDEQVSYLIRTYVGGVLQETTGHYNTTAQVDAPATLGGKQFSYWRAIYDDVNILPQITSFYASYRFVVTTDVTLEAVYGEPVSLGIATRISGDTPNYEAASITLFAEHSVTPDYTVIQHGIIFTEDPTIGNFEDRLVISANMNSAIKKGTANNTDLVGTYSARITKWYAVDAQGGYYYPVKYARSYVIAQDRNGVVYTIYSPIYTADYHDRIFEANDFEDPFGT